MGGRIGPNGVGYMQYNGAHVTIRRDVLESPDFDAVWALAEADRVAAEDARELAEDQGGEASGR